LHRRSNDVYSAFLRKEQPSDSLALPVNCKHRKIRIENRIETHDQSLTDKDENDEACATTETEQERCAVRPRHTLDHGAFPAFQASHATRQRIKQCESNSSRKTTRRTTGRLAQDGRARGAEHDGGGVAKHGGAVRANGKTKRTKIGRMNEQRTMDRFKMKETGRELENHTNLRERNQKKRKTTS
jgi:hypothetical protein